jgi:hypothetical protein
VLVAFIRKLRLMSILIIVNGTAIRRLVMILMVMMLIEISHFFVLSSIQISVNKKFNFFWFASGVLLLISTHLHLEMI